MHCVYKHCHISAQSKPDQILLAHMILRKIVQRTLGLVIFFTHFCALYSCNRRPNRKFLGGILFQTAVSTKSLPQLVNSMAAAVDILGRLGLEHPEKSNLCNWSVDQKLTAGTISALNLTETNLWGKGKYEYTLQQGTSLNRSFEMIFAINLVKCGNNAKAQRKGLLNQV